MKEITAVIFRSAVDGILHINGQYAGICGEENVLSIPWNGTSVIVASVSPIGTKYMSVNVLIEVKDGDLLPCEGIDFIIWPGILEVVINPPRRIPYPLPLNPVEIKRRSFSTPLGSLYSVLVDYCGTWWIIEKGGNTLMCEFISPDAVNGLVTLEILSPALLSLAYDDKLACAGQNMGNFDILFNGRGAMQREGGLSIIDESTSVKTYHVLSATDSHVLMRAKHPSASVSSEDEAAARFLSMMAQQNYAGAWDLLSRSLKAELAENEIVSFIGEIDSVMPCRYIPGIKQPSYAGRIKLKNNIYAARPFLFNVNSDMEIVNITPI